MSMRETPSGKYKIWVVTYHEKEGTTMANKKMTKVEMFSAIRAQLSDPEQIDFITHEIELVEKRNARKSSTPSKADLAKREAYMEMRDWILDNPASTCAAIADAFDLSLHAVTGKLTQLRKMGEVKREYQGKTPVYSVGKDAAYFPDEQ